MGFKHGILPIYIALAVIAVFLLIAWLAPKISDNFGFLSQSKQSQESLAANTKDSDGDGFSDEKEAYLGTDPNADCAKDSKHDAWPPDFNKDRTVDMSDVLSYRKYLNKRASSTNKRYDLNMDKKINMSDVISLRPYFRKSCTPNPSPTPTTHTWILCANEWETCTFSGTKEVRFGTGTDDSYSYGTHTDSAYCHWSVFADPASGKAKKCWYDDQSVTPSPTPTPFPSSAFGTISGGKFSEDDNKMFGTAEGEIPPGAVVTLHAAGGNVIKTDDETTGAFNFSNLDPGGYNIQATTPPGWITRFCISSPSVCSDYSNSGGSSLVTNVNIGENETNSVWFYYRKTTTSQ